MAFPVLDPARCVPCGLCERACVEVRYGPATDIEVMERRRLAIHPGPRLAVCTDCAEAPCIPVCPHDALLRHPDGRVQLHESRCTGCGHCIGACTYGAIRRVNVLNLALKCDACAPLGIEPACVVSCPSSALSISTWKQMTESRCLSFPPSTE